MNRLPFAMPGRFWRGNLHTHSTNSDGHLSPAETVVWYRDAEELFTPAQVQALTSAQIENYCQQARAKNILWATSMPAPQRVEQLEACVV